MSDRERPPAIRLGVAPEVDPETGDFFFRFPLPKIAHHEQEDLFRHVVEEQLRALLDIVELSEDGRALRVTGYRLLSESEFRPLDGDRGGTAT